LFTVLLAENCRVPFDDPNTHLELTMIHEVMVLDHSGPPLAVVLHGAAMKLLLFAVLLVEAVLPFGDWPGPRRGERCWGRGWSGWGWAWWNRCWRVTRSSGCRCC
jgi:NADH:ubiquinone oxidoreductase subunit H